MRKKLFSVLLSVAMTSAMTVPAFAMEQNEATNETQDIDTSGIEISNYYSCENDDEIGISYDISIDVDKYSSPEALGEALEKAMTANLKDSSQPDEEISDEVTPKEEPENKAEEKATRPNSANTKKQDAIFTEYPVRLFLTIF